MARIMAYLPALALYVGLVTPAAFTRRPRLFAALTGLHVAIYLLIAVVSPFLPEDLSDPAYGETPVPTTAAS
jgi:hypothetical protein